MILSVTMTLLPIVLIVFLMIKKGYAADTSGMTGWLLTLVIAYLFFDTTMEVGLRSSAAGIVASVLVPVILAVRAGFGYDDADLRKT